MTDFALGDILSITTEHLVSRDHIEGVYRILNHMTGDNLFTHQLPRAAAQCKPHLLAQHPQLADIEVPEFSGGDSVLAWLSEQEARFGETLPVAIIPESDYVAVNPIQELADMVGPEKVVVVEVPDA